MIFPVTAPAMTDQFARLLAPPVTRREWQQVLIFGLIVMGATTVPYLVALLQQNGIWHFTGFLMALDDSNSYLAKMREGAHGGWLFHLVYTSEPHSGALLFIPYLALGKLAALLPGGSDALLTPIMVILFHLARIIGGIFAILASYAFAAVFLPPGRSRWLALVLIVLGGGLGWLLIVLGKDSLLGSLPTDFYIPEGYTFLSLYGLPHLAIARAALLTGMTCLLRAADQPQSPARWRPALGAGILWLLVGLCVPFYLAVIDILLLAWGVAIFLRTRRLDWHWLGRAFIAALIPSPVLLYSLAVTLTNPTFAMFNAQNQLPSPNPLQYVLGYIVLAIPAIAGVRWAWQRAGEPAAGSGFMLLPAWVITGITLAYTPVSVQRRLLEGIFVPLCVLAVAGLTGLRTGYEVPVRTRRDLRRSRLLIGMTVVLTLPSSVFILALGILGATHPGQPEFQSTAEISAINWLGTHAPASSVVLSSLEIGNYLPSQTDLRAFLGHGVETLDSQKKAGQVQAFFSGQQSLAQIQTAQQDPITYIFYNITDPDEGTSATRAIWSQGLIPIYDQDGITIYQVPPKSAP